MINYKLIDKKSKLIDEKLIKEENLYTTYKLLYRDENNKYKLTDSVEDLDKERTVSLGGYITEENGKKVATICYVDVINIPNYHLVSYYNGYAIKLSNNREYLIQGLIMLGEKMAENALLLGVKITDDKGKENYRYFNSASFEIHKK